MHSKPVYSLRIFRCLAYVLVGRCAAAFGGGTDWVPPDDWPAAKRVDTFLQASLENCILAPLDSPAAPPRVALSALGIDFAAHLQAADSPLERTLYNKAAGICDMLGRLLDERDAAQAALFNAQSGGYANNPLDEPAFAPGGHYTGKPWVDYMVLSPDGKTMIGKGRNNKLATYLRQ